MTPSEPSESGQIQTRSLPEPRCQQDQDQSAGRHHQIVVIGAGASGLGAGMRLRAEGFTDFVILEKHACLGGTWRDNTYPGCACDVPSALYSYSFAPKPDWSRAFAGQEEILAYLRHTAEAANLAPHLRFGTELRQARWSEGDRRWHLDTNQGPFTAEVVISAIGYLHQPAMPAIPGLDRFPGPVFHSSRWDHDADLVNKRVAVIGTGASAIQFVPRLQTQVAALHVFQRTPHWILPKPDGPIPGLGHAALRIPWVLAAWRRLLFHSLEIFGVGFRRPAILRRVELISRAMLRLQIRDQTLRGHLTPDYTLGCKRVLFSNEFYPAVAQPNVVLHPTAVVEVAGTAVVGGTVVGADGSQAEVDAIILATGFDVTDRSTLRHVYGRSGRSLSDHWRGSPQAFRGTTVHDFPNAFLLLGPNLAIGNNSAFLVIEAQLNYIIDALRIRRDRCLSVVEVQADAQCGYNDLVQQELAASVWNAGGCNSYYLDANGRNSVAFPWSTARLQESLNRFDLDAYQTIPGDLDPT